MLSWPRKIRSKVVPLKGSIQEPNLPSKNLLQPSINRTRHNLNPTWGSGGISSICRVPVSSTFWQWSVKKVKHKKNHVNFVRLTTWAPSDLGGKTRQAFPVPSQPSSSNIFHLEKISRVWRNDLRDEIMWADLRPNCGGSLTAGATALAPIFNGFSSLKTDHSHHIEDYLIWVAVNGLSFPTVWDL